MFLNGHQLLAMSYKMRIYSRMTLIFTVGVILLIPTQAIAKKFFSFQGQRQGWYFNVPHPDARHTPSDQAIASSSQRAIGIKGPFSTNEDCAKASESLYPDEYIPCYKRETVEFYQWRIQKTLAWIVPLRTGSQSSALVFKNKKDCHRVAVSGFYFTRSKVKVQQHQDLQICIVGEVSFDEYEEPYPFVYKHPQTDRPYPKRYRAWSIVVEQGRFVKLLQFAKKEDCELVAQNGNYYSLLPHTGYSSVQVAYEIPAHLRKCHQQAPQKNEVPVFYAHIRKHKNKKDRISDSVPLIAQRIVWVLGVQHVTGLHPLYFKTKQECLRVLQDGFYFKKIDRGWLFSSQRIKKIFEFVRGGCTQTKLPIQEDQYYPFLHHH